MNEQNKDINAQDEPELQVLICTYGKEGIGRVASTNHPEVDGVEYLVSWQTDSDYPIPEELRRKDFKIYTSRSKGLSVNRNTALSLATAPFLLISDDDAEYSANGLKEVIDSFHQHPEADILTFRYASSSTEKYYPTNPVDISTPPKGYFISSIEIAFKKSAVKGCAWFNQNFGIGATFPSGEEDVFIRDCLNLGMSGTYLPITIARHDGPTTSEKNLMLPTRPLTKGAVFLHLHPRDWPLRMIVHALREIPLWIKGLVPSPYSYCRNWMKGVAKARRLRVFPTPDYAKLYRRHE